MIVLGLGSNIGDRIHYLRLALIKLKQHPNIVVKKVSPLYASDALLPENAPMEWNIPFLNAGVRIETTLDPAALLNELKKMEKDLGRDLNAPRWSPRVIDMDILCFDDITQNDSTLTLPHPRLLERSFALWPLADVAPFWRYPLTGDYFGKTMSEIIESLGSRFDGQGPFRTRQIQQRIDMPQLVAALNVTPDSFSDGGHFTQLEKAMEQCIQLVNAGADVIDIGAESTAPRATPITPDTEWQRLEPVLKSLVEIKSHFIIPPKISIDTRHAAVAKKALNYPIDWINDVTGLQDPAMQDVIAHSQVDCVIMHHLTIPPTRKDILPREQDVVKFIYDWASERIQHLSKIGITPERIIIDPGIGFGKSDEHYLELLKHAGVFKKLGVNVLIGHSRKSFLQQFTPEPAHSRDIETQAISLALAKQPIDYLRVHNIDMCARGLKIMAALQD